MEQRKIVCVRVKTSYNKTNTVEESLQKIANNKEHELHELVLIVRFSKRQPETEDTPIYSI